MTGSTWKRALALVCVGWALAAAVGLRAADGDVEAGAPAAATVLALAPGAQVEDETGWTALEEGQLLDAGDHVRTDARGTLQLLLADGSSLALGHNSEITLRSLGQGGETSVTLVSLARGLLNAMVEHLRPGARFEVQTANAVAAVKGTDFEMAVGDDDQGSVVTVREGTVQMGKPDRLEFKAVTPGRACRWARGRFEGPYDLSPAQVIAFRGRWAMAHDIHARRRELLKEVLHRHLGQRQRFLKELRLRRENRHLRRADSPEERQKLRQGLEAQRNARRGRRAER